MHRRRPHRTADRFRPLRLAAGAGFVVLVTGDVGSADIELAEVGFHACDRDLEDELLRAVGPDGAQAVIEAAGEATSLRLLAQMPSQRGWTREEVLRRFLTSAGWDADGSSRELGSDDVDVRLRQVRLHTDLG